MPIALYDDRRIVCSAGRFIVRTVSDDNAGGRLGNDVPLMLRSWREGNVQHELRKGQTHALRVCLRRVQFVVPVDAPQGWELQIVSCEGAG